MTKFKETDTLTGVGLKSSISCVSCRIALGNTTGLQPYLFKPLRFYLPDESIGHAVDVWLTCPDCGLTQVHGVAITARHYRRICEQTTQVLGKDIILNAPARIPSYKGPIPNAVLV